jgi:hypothetical protein
MDRNVVLENYHLIEEHIYSEDRVKQLLKAWRIECQSTPSDADVVTLPNKRTHLYLVKQ